MKKFVWAQAIFASVLLILSLVFDWKHNIYWSAFSIYVGFYLGWECGKFLISQCLEHDREKRGYDLVEQLLRLQWTLVWPLLIVGWMLRRYELAKFEHRAYQIKKNDERLRQTTGDVNGLNDCLDRVARSLREAGTISSISTVKEARARSGPPTNSIKKG